jgi:methyl-accepting chemotaxis protein
MLKNITLAARLGYGFSVVLFFAVILGIAGAMSLSSVMGGFRAVTTDVLPKTRLANQNIQAAYDYARAFAYVITSSETPGVDHKSIESARVVLVDTVKLVNDNMATLTKLLQSPEEKALLQQVTERRASYGKSRNMVLELSNAGKGEQASQLMFTETNALQTAYIESIKDFIRHEEALLQKSVESAEDTHSTARTTLILIVLAALFAGVFVTLSVTRHVLKVLGGEPEYATHIVGRLSAGDLSVSIQTKPGDRSSLLFAMKGMRDSLATIVGQVRSGTDQIATASDQIAAGSLDLSSRTEEQASSLQQTASSMEQLSSTVKLNADHASQASRLATASSTVAVQGGEVVGQVVETMKEINDSSRRISEIIGVVDAIAFQTNILALNAAVEAARAGEQGRGFAVVASEVRNLAMRSADASREIKALIAANMGRVEQGASLVDQAGTTMQEVVKSIKRVAEIVNEISSASAEQSSGVAQVGQAMTHMDQATQQNAALVEESAAAAESLKQQARQLVESVAVFVLEPTRTARQA